MHAQSQLGYDLYVFAYTEVQLMHLHLTVTSIDYCLNKQTVLFNIVVRIFCLVIFTFCKMINFSYSRAPSKAFSHS